MIGSEVATLKCRDCRRSWEQPYNSAAQDLGYDPLKHVVCPKCGEENWYVVRYHRRPAK